MIASLRDLFDTYESARRAIGFDALAAQAEDPENIQLDAQKFSDKLKYLVRMGKALPGA